MNIILFFALYDLTSLGSFFNAIVYFIADMFPYIILFAAALFLFLRYKLYAYRSISKSFTKKCGDALLVVLPVAVAWTVSDILKKAIHSPRPFIEFGNVHPLFIESGYGFPSSHATVFASLAVALFFVDKKVGYWYMLFAFLIGIARIIAGVHFPGDILGGFILGAGISVLFNLYFTAQKR